MARTPGKEWSKRRVRDQGRDAEDQHHEALREYVAVVREDKHERNIRWLEEMLRDPHLDEYARNDIERSLTWLRVEPSRTLSLTWFQHFERIGRRLKARADGVPPLSREEGQARNKKYVAKARLRRAIRQEERSKMPAFLNGDKSALPLKPPGRP